uniref:Uncharacterized protein n=1 Tax=Laticauda laticaudata TaxID=8630 RepID=A0A8C5SNQ3_LATLA
MASRRMETKPVITCLKTLLIIYSFVFWVSTPKPRAGSSIVKVKRVEGIRSGNSPPPGWVYVPSALASSEVTEHCNGNRSAGSLLRKRLFACSPPC